jgi:hypothetical protein
VRPGARTALSRLVGCPTTEAQPTPSRATAKVLSYVHDQPRRDEDDAIPAPLRHALRVRWRPSCRESVGRMTGTLPQPLPLFIGVATLASLACAVRRQTSLPRLYAEDFGITLAIIGAVWLG